ncbi:DUF2092 domain-containing protein [Ensifer sp. B1-9]|uniref:DUF2092 domain-containing protein n=1 Tax=Ensifer sp. B1-9 TaxID=3141455 RepID=UPI003D24A02E
MHSSNHSDQLLSLARYRPGATNPYVDDSGRHETIATLEKLVRATALAILVGFAALPAARAGETAPPPAVTDEVESVVSQMGKTLRASDMTITARTIRAYLDESGQPLHIFHTIKIAARRPDKIAVEFSGDDGKHDLFYDGKEASVFFPDSRKYVTISASGDIPSALDEVANRLDIDFPLSVLFAGAPDKVLLDDATAAREVGTGDIDGMECRHLFFSQRSGIDLELWVEKNSVAKPRRLIVIYRLLPGQPRFVAEFTSWEVRSRLPDAEFAFRPPADATKIELTPAVAPQSEVNKR